jgi:hypothetical protein
MPKQYDTRVSQRQVLDPISKPEKIAATVHATDQFVADTGQNTDLAQFAAGLTKFNPHLAAFGKQIDTGNAHQAFAEGQAEQERQALDPNYAVNSAAAMPEPSNVAFKANFKTGYNEALSTRLAVGVQNDMLDAWSKVRMTEQDPEKFIKEWTAKNTAGFTDPTQLQAITKAHVETVKSIRTDARGLQMKAVEKSSRESVDAALGSITPDMTNEQMHDTFQKSVVPLGVGTGYFTRPELAVKFAERLNALSLTQNGSPEVFDAMREFKDPVTGKSLVEMNPQLAVQVEGYRRAAEHQRDGRLVEAMKTVNFEKQLMWEARVNRGDMPTDAEYKAEIGPLAMFQTEEAALAHRHKSLKALGAQQELAAGIALANAGQLWAVGKPEDQKKIMDHITDPAVAAIMGTVNSNDPQAASIRNQAMGMIVKAHSSSGASVPNTRLKNFFGSVAQQVITKDSEPTPSFLLAASIYSQMPPNLKSVYADGDAAQVLEHFSAMRGNGPETQLDAKSAYHQAYSAISPEAKARATEREKDPAFNAGISSMVKNLTTPWYRDVFGFQALGTYPTNETAVAEYAQREAKQFLMRNPNAGDSALKAHVQSWYAGRFVYENASNTIVEVPGGETGEGTTKALTSYISKLQKENPKADPTLRYMGNGQYQVWALNGNKMLDTVRLQDIKDTHYNSEHLDQKTGEGARMASLQKSLLDGTATQESISKEAALIAKAKTIGIWNPEMDKRVDGIRRAAFKDNMGNLLGKTPKPTNDNLDFSPSAGRTKTEVAQRYWQQGSFGKALTVMGEGIVLKATPDPASGAGNNIGVAYNLNANAGNIAEDFRRSGIPAEHIEGIKAGTTSITQEQAMRLLDVAYGRAEETASGQIDKLYGKGSWAQLANNKKAVIIDVAYQVGSIAKFPNALRNMMTDAEGGNPIVHYSKDGTMVKDERRNNLRAHMLAGEAQFGTIIDEVARKPRSRIEAQQLVQK